MKKFKFKKMHGLGNCFIMMDNRSNVVIDLVDITSLAVRVCDRNIGIGADGLILVQESNKFDFRMTIINGDGSEAEMCGNGVRCFARFLLDEKITDKRDLEIETLAGLIRTSVKEDDLVVVDMGPPVFNNDDVRGTARDGKITVDAQGHSFTFVSMGNPHAITFVDNYDLDWRKDGALVEHDQAFPNQINVEFIKVLDDKEIVMKVWERGCGETMACGTGACASVVAGIETGQLRKGEVIVHLPGGDLAIQWSGSGNVMMTGPAVTVSTGLYFY